MLDPLSYANQAEASRRTGGFIPHPSVQPMEGGPFSSPEAVAHFGRVPSNDAKGAGGGLVVAFVLGMIILLCFGIPLEPVWVVVRDTWNFLTIHGWPKTLNCVVVGFGISVFIHAFWKLFKFVKRQWAAVTLAAYYALTYHLFIYGDYKIFDDEGNYQTSLLYKVIVQVIGAVIGYCIGLKLSSWIYKPEGRVGWPIPVNLILFGNTKFKVLPAPVKFFSVLLILGYPTYLVVVKTWRFLTVLGTEPLYANFWCSSSLFKVIVLLLEIGVWIYIPTRAFLPRWTSRLTSKSKSVV